MNNVNWISLNCDADGRQVCWTRRLLADLFTVEEAVYEEQNIKVDVGGENE